MTMKRADGWLAGDGRLWLARSPQGWHVAAHPELEHDPEFDRAVEPLRRRVFRSRAAALAVANKRLVEAGLPPVEAVFSAAAGAWYARIGAVVVRLDRDERGREWAAELVEGTVRHRLAFARDLGDETWPSRPRALEAIETWSASIDTACTPQYRCRVSTVEDGWWRTIPAAHGHAAVDVVGAGG